MKACCEDSALTEDSPESVIKKSAKKRKSTSSVVKFSNTEDMEAMIVQTPKKIKRELSFRDVGSPATPIKIKKEEENS